MTSRLKRPLLPQIGVLLSLLSYLAIGAQFAAAAPTPSPAKPSGPATSDKQIDAIFKEWDTSRSEEHTSELQSP